MGRRNQGLRAMPDDQKDPPMPDDQKDPLEGFQITDYDPETEFVTIQIHRSILGNARQREAVAKRAVEIIEGGPGVRGVHIEPRK
jgi:hypothetical protein